MIYPFNRESSSSLGKVVVVAVLTCVLMCAFLCCGISPLSDSEMEKRSRTAGGVSSNGIPDFSVRDPLTGQLRRDLTGEWIEAGVYTWMRAQPNENAERICSVQVGECVQVDFQEGGSMWVKASLYKFPINCTGYWVHLGDFR